MRTPLRVNHGKITFVLYNKPFPCGGKCLYCFQVKGLTKSTTENEDTLLAKNCGWSGGKQLEERFRRYGLRRGSGLKCDLAVKGDSFDAHEPDYLRRYTKEIYDFLNGEESETLEEASRRQMRAKDRCVTYKVETRPERIDEGMCLFFAELGVTSVELGVQSLNEEVLERNRRGHDTAAVKKATGLLRRFGFEICYQVMVGLPGSTVAIDRQLLTEELWKEEYGPDALKIYPCLLLKKKIARQAGLRRLFQQGSWKPLSEGDYVNLLNECYHAIPRYVHVNRIQRIIPQNKIEAGPAGEIDRMRFNHVSRCLWQRSPAQKLKDADVQFRKYGIIEHPQGENRYCFEALFDNDTVLGYGRFDILSGSSAIVRDIRVLGNMVPIGRKSPDGKGCQHVGIGGSILAAMELKAKENNLSSIIIKPSFGASEWFQKRGYGATDGYYLTKTLAENGHP